MRRAGIAGLWVLLFVGSLLTAAAGETLSPDEQALSQRAPAALPAFRRASHAAATGDDAEAVAGFEEVVGLAPDFPPALRALSVALHRRKDLIAAKRYAEKAFELDPGPESRVALATVLLDDNVAPMKRTIEILEKGIFLEPHDRRLLLLRAEAALLDKDSETAKKMATELKRVAPGDARTHRVAALSALLDGRKRQAQREALAADAAGLVGFSASLADRTELTPWERTIEIATWTMVGWLAAMLLFFLVGWSLSRVQLERLERVAREGSDDAAREGVAIYRALLPALSVFFYLSLPLCLAIILAIGVGAALIGFTWIIPALTIALIGLFMGLLRRSRITAPGVELNRNHHPQLYKLTGDVAALLQTRPIERIFLQTGAEAAVIEIGSRSAVSRGRGERVLLIGLAAIDAVDDHSLRAIVAHEYGHFMHGDTAQIWPHRVRASLETQLRTMVEGGGWVVLNPAFWMLRIFLRTHLMITLGARRVEEVLADRRAAGLFGGAAFASGLRRVIESGVRRRRLAERLFDEGVPETPLDLYRELGKRFDDEEEAEIAAEVEQELGRSLTRYDSHPPPARRMEWTAHLPCSVPQPAAAPARSLLGAIDSFERDASASFGRLIWGSRRRAGIRGR